MGAVLARGGAGFIAVAGGVAAVDSVSDSGDAGRGTLGAGEGDTAAAGAAAGLPGEVVI